MGRVSTLEETLFSFLNQDDLTDCEMVIVNDYPRQNLIFNHPQVRIFNRNPFKTIGEKENFAVEQCKGDIIAVTDDDDVYMSNHNTNIKKYFDFSKPMLHWKGVYYNEPEITEITFIGNSGMVYSKAVWEEVGKHPIMNAGGDSVFSEKVHTSHGYVAANLPDSEVSAFYRWKMISDMIYHQSGMGTDDEKTFPNVITRHQQHVEALRKKGLIPTGDIYLKPNWKQDYKQLLIDFNKKTNGTSRTS